MVSSLSTTLFVLLVVCLMVLVSCLNMLVCGGRFVAEGDSVVVCMGRLFVSLPMYSSPQCMGVLFLIPSFIEVFLPYVCFVLLCEGSDFKV